MFQSAAFSSVVANAFVDAVPANGTTADWEAWYRSTSFVSAPSVNSLHPLLTSYDRVLLIG